AGGRRAEPCGEHSYLNSKEIVWRNRLCPTITRRCYGGAGGKGCRQSGTCGPATGGVSFASSSRKCPQSKRGRCPEGVAGIVARATGGGRWIHDRAIRQASSREVF